MKFFGGNDPNDPASRKIATLKEIPIFQPLSRNEILEVDELLHERIYEKDEIIFEEGDAGHGIFIILSGKVRVKSRCKLLDAVAPVFGPGELLGELTLFEEAPRVATAVAIERTVTAALFQAEFSALLTKNKSIGVKVLFEISKIMGRRMRRLLLQEADLPSV